MSEQIEIPDVALEAAALELFGGFTHDWPKLTERRRNVWRDKAFRAIQAAVLFEAAQAVEEKDQEIQRLRDEWDAESEKAEAVEHECDQAIEQARQGERERVADVMLQALDMRAELDEDTAERVAGIILDTLEDGT